jgi:hypothetical protein
VNAATAIASRRAGYRTAVTRASRHSASVAPAARRRPWSTGYTSTVATARDVTVALGSEPGLSDPNSGRDGVAERNSARSSGLWQGAHAYGRGRSTLRASARRKGANTRPNSGAAVCRRRRGRHDGQAASHRNALNLWVAHDCPPTSHVIITHQLSKTRAQPDLELLLVLCGETRPKRRGLVRC